ncbi:hypothetical protein TYRP_008194 [Tyrophagus putrescentiae]|nr:hypothetical protein TYRP_008194 [Tyrophagus putrescentiae]
MLVRIARSLEMIAEFLMFSDVARSTPQDLRPAADLWLAELGFIPEYFLGSICDIIAASAIRVHFAESLSLIWSDTRAHLCCRRSLSSAESALLIPVRGVPLPRMRPGDVQEFFLFLSHLPTV